MKKRNNSGITLIALVITIIVLLILAGISIAMLTGSNGILSKATEADIMNARGEAADRINLALNGVFTDLIAAQYVDGEDADIQKTDIETENGLTEEAATKVGKYNVGEVNVKAEAEGDVVRITWHPDDSRYGADVVGYIKAKEVTEDTDLPFEIVPAKYVWEAAPTPTPGG